MILVRNINLADITANPYQPRSTFDREKLSELSESIKRDGMIEPVVLRRVIGGFEIIAGERRCRAAELAGMTHVPAIVMNADDSQSARLALIENIQREDLNAIEEAKAFAQLLKIENCTQEELAKRIGKSQSTIANKIRLLNLSEEVQDAVTNGILTERQARALLNVPSDKQGSMMLKIQEMNLDSAATENYLKETLNKQPNKKPKRKVTINKLFVQNANVALNTIRRSIKSIKKSNLAIEEYVMEKEDEYIMTIRIKKS